MKKTNNKNLNPYFSICIPQYNRTDFLLKALESFSRQTFTNFEVCIYDDNSNDDGMEKILNYLENSALSYCYFRSKNNGRYDASLRGAIGLSNGRYVFLMGNDDGLADCKTLELIHDHIKQFNDISVVITNYIELTTGERVMRVAKTKIYGEGACVASSLFRNYAFVSGIILKGEAARGLSTEKLDGSEMYQMYLATSIVSSGGQALGIEDICIQKDLQIPGQEVDSYKTQNTASKCFFKAIELPMARIFEVISAGLSDVHDPKKKEKYLFSIANQLYKYTYPYWIIEYRRVRTWCYSFSVYRGLNPLVICGRIHQFPFYLKSRLFIRYVIMGVVGFLMPIFIFDKVRPMLFRAAKKNL